MLHVRIAKTRAVFIFLQSPLPVPGARRLSSGPRLGIMADDGVHDVTAATEALPALRWPLPPGDQLIANLDA